MTMSAIEQLYQVYLCTKVEMLACVCKQALELASWACVKHWYRMLEVLLVKCEGAKCVALQNVHAALPRPQGVHMS